MTDASAASFFPTTTTTKSVADESERIAAESNVSLEALCPASRGGHGNRALSRPMRDDFPAAWITPAKLAARVMQRRYQGTAGNCRFLGCPSYRQAQFSRVLRAPRPARHPLRTASLASGTNSYGATRNWHAAGSRSALP